MVNICEETGLTLPDCECDDCTSQMLNLIRNAIIALNDNLDSEILSQLQEISNNFANYYNKEQVNSLIDTSGGLRFEEVETLPDDPSENVIYLVPLQDGEGNCNYDKWFFYNNQWESMNCGGETEVIRLDFITECGTESFTYMGSGTFPTFADVCPEGADDPNITFNGWYCALDDQTLYAEGDAIPQGFFDGTLCTALEANITKSNYMVFMDLDGLSEEGVTEIYPAVFPNYSDLFIVTTPLAQDEEFWWEYSYGGTGSVETGTMFAEGDTIPSEFYEYNGGSAQDPTLSPHFIGVVRKRTNFFLESNVDIDVEIYTDGVLNQTVELPHGVVETINVYDSTDIDARPTTRMEESRVHKLLSLDFDVPNDIGCTFTYQSGSSDAIPPIVLGITDKAMPVGTTGSEAYDILVEGVMAYDSEGNLIVHGENGSITVSGWSSAEGTYVLTYSVTDENNNVTSVYGAKLVVGSGEGEQPES